MTNASVAVLGSGMAGVGAGYALQLAQVPFVCYDKNSYCGGHTSSKRYKQGFLFDEGPHISFTKDERIKELLAASVRGEFDERRFAIDNYWRGHRIPHPVQCHLHGLPVDLLVRVIKDFAGREYTHEMRAGEGGGIDGASGCNRARKKTYADWLLTVYGKTFAETFPMTYGRKYHTAPMDQLTTEWIGPRMYQPTLDEVVKGALESRPADKHYIQVYRYPSRGGFVSYLEGFARTFDVRLNHRVVCINPREKLLHFSNGEIHAYSDVISSIPLPDLVPLIDGVPSEVVEASKKLAFSTVVLVNVGLSRQDISEAATTYFYDEDIIFSRVSLPHMFSSNNAPEGHGSIQAEVYFSDKYKPLSADLGEVASIAIKDLRRCGFIKEHDNIVMTDAVVSRYANVIYDFDRAAALALVHEYLDESRIHYCGRFGRWDHSWTDEAFISGEESARRVLCAS